MSPYRQMVQIAKELSDWIDFVTVLIHYNRGVFVRGYADLHPFCRALRLTTRRRSQNLR